MEIEQPITREISSVRKVSPTSTRTKTTTSSPLPNELCNRSESFRTLEIGVPKSISSEKRLAWLRSQIIGDDVEFCSPFGKRRLTYADHTASGRSLHYIENFITNNVLPFYGNTHTCDSYVGHRTTKMVHEATQYIKRSLGGGEDDAIMFCGSGTTAAIKRLQEVMGIAVPSTMRDRLIKCLSSEEIWVVFVGPYEHHSNLLSWRQSLAEVIEIGLDGSGLIDMEALKKLLDSYQKANRPILGSFSASSNVTGIFSHTRELAQLLHQYGGFVCFDFAASGPYVEIDMRSGEIDGYDDTLYLDDIEERENGGTPQIIQTIRAALAFWVKEYISYKVIEEQEHKYLSKALKRLKYNKNIGILGNISAKRQAILSFLIFSTTNSSSSKDPSSERKEEDNLYMWAETGNKRDKPLHGAFVAALLNDLFGIQSRGGCACAGPYGHLLLNISETVSLALRSAIHQGYMGVKPGWTRISFPYYMSNEEFEFIIAAVEFIAIYGQRFLPLYRFNFKTGAWSFKKKANKDLVVGKENSCNAFPLAGAAKDNGEVMDKQASYLKSAIHIANLLPKFPPPRKLPQGLDHNLLYFRV
eukprot:XP_025015313.1 uncharacterized protein LOC8273528 [Ricinus communis]